MTTMNETVRISVEEYQKLMEDSVFLDCLMQAGVDNWDGYDEARALMDTEDE